jgi:hypothetical protein
MGMFTKTKKEEALEMVSKRDFNSHIEENNQIILKMNETIKIGKDEAERNAVEKSIELIDKLENKYTMLEKNYQLLNNKIEDIENVSLEHNERINKTESKIDTFRFDDTGKFEEFKSTCRNRVHYLLGKKSDPKYILFYRSFIIKIYSDIYTYFKAQNSSSIKMDDAETVIGMAKKWRPNKRYVWEKIIEYQKRQEKGTLEAHKSNALDIFMDEIGGDHRNAFQ